jgi:catechol 2,3-dioxygenase-like lactoylglutathione lyase family enzyme
VKLNHTSVVCCSEERAERFYGEILGLERVKDFVIDKDLTRAIFDREGECRIIGYGSEAFTIEVFIPSPMPEAARRPFVHICLEADDPEGLLATCEKEGLEVRRVPRGAKEVCFVKDPDGNLFEIK